MCGADASIHSLSPVHGPSHDGCSVPTADPHPELPPLPPSCHASATEYASARASGDYLLLDVRSPLQFELCHLPEALSIPLASLPASMRLLGEAAAGKDGIFCICRRGVDSQVAARILIQGLEHGSFGDGSFGAGHVKHVSGGLLAWAASVDDAFPSF